MADDDSNSNDGNGTAQCGACQAMIPSNSERCPECNVSFTGIEDVDMGECGSCKAIIPEENPGLVL